jgi:hypothetical protein
VQRAARWGGFSFDEKEQIRKGSLAALDLLDVPKQERDEMFRERHMVNRFDYAGHALGGHTIPQEIQGSNDLTSEWKSLRNGGFQRIPSAETIEKFLRKAGMLNAERAELLEDYRHYEEHGEHRRPDVWKRLHDRDR